jgi:HK97 family phage major capsid protein
MPDNSTGIDPLAYVLTRMQEMKPRYDELANKDTLTDEERTEYVRTKADWDSLDERRRDVEERQNRALAASSINFTVNRNPDPFDSDLKVSRNQALGLGKGAVEKMQNKFASREQAEQITRLIERGGSVGETAARLAVTTGSDEYRESYWGAMTGRAFNQRVLDRALDEYRAMTAGTGASGGYMVPLYMDPSFSVTGTGAYNPIRDVATVKQITTLTYNGSNAAQVTAAILGENVAYSDNTPTVAQIQLPTYKYGAYIPASFEAFEDIDTLASDVAMLFSDAKYNLEATQFETGSGSAPHGVVTDVTAITASRVAPATGGTFVVGDLYKVHSALPPRYRRGPSQNRAWSMSVNIIDTVRQFATANNYHAFLTDLSNGQPPQLLGDSLIEASTMSTSVTTGQNILLFGDFSKFLIIDRVGVSTEFIPNVFDQASGRPSGTRAWLMHWRFGSGIADANAFRVLLL